VWLKTKHLDRFGKSTLLTSKWINNFSISTDFLILVHEVTMDLSQIYSEDNEKGTQEMRGNRTL